MGLEGIMPTNVNEPEQQQIHAEFDCGGVIIDSGPDRPTHLSFSVDAAIEFADLVLATARNAQRHHEAVIDVWLNKAKEDGSENGRDWIHIIASWES
jgi:hypothetical protein